MKTSFGFIILFIITTLGCTHTIKRDVNIIEYYNKIERLSQKREGKIYIFDDKSISTTIYTGKSIFFYQDSVKFYCQSSLKNITFPIHKINRIVFNSGSDGGAEGILPGILFGTITGMASFSIGESIKNNNKPSVDFDPGTLVPYYVVSIPMGILLGYSVASKIGKYVFIIN